jgi:nitroreductase
MNEVIDLINSHCSIRKYSSRNIANDLMDSLLAAACRASNTGNMQTYSIVVSTDEELKQQLAPAHFNQKMITDAPAVLTFCADFHRFTKWCSLRNAEAGYTNFQSFIGAAVDAVLAAQNFAIAAESEGLGICYLGTTTYNAQEISEILKLPKLVVPITTITVGYPAENEQQTDRLPLTAIVHHEVYEAYTEEKINAIYAEKENAKFYQKFVAENGKQTLAQVFTDVRYPRTNNEFFSEKFLNALKQQGFLG